LRPAMGKKSQGETRARLSDAENPGWGVPIPGKVTKL